MILNLKQIRLTYIRPNLIPNYISFKLRRELFSTFSDGLYDIIGTVLFISISDVGNFIEFFFSIEGSGVMPNGLFVKVQSFFLF